MFILYCMYIFCYFFFQHCFLFVAYFLQFLFSLFLPLSSSCLLFYTLFPFVFLSLYINTISSVFFLSIFDQVFFIPRSSFYLILFICFIPFLWYYFFTFHSIDIFFCSLSNRWRKVRVIEILYSAFYNVIIYINYLLFSQ